MNEGIAGWFNSIVNYGVSIIWGNNDWLIASNPWYGLLMFVLIGAGLYFTVATRFIQFRHFVICGNYYGCQIKAVKMVVSARLRR